MNMDKDDDGGPEINGLSGWYDVFQVYRGKHVTVMLRENPTPLAGVVEWVGSHLVELSLPLGQSNWIRIDSIAAITTRASS